jgi:hypothetical protein
MAARAKKPDHKKAWIESRLVIAHLQSLCARANSRCRIVRTAWNQVGSRQLDCHGRPNSCLAHPPP